ncbi:type VI secretion system tip protein VgrG [Burkholderia multivorans]|uniref:type VI secretion system Vgr family protein n=1 Tax=Burkholderia ubonensis TaxID=101571 RepID=UPI000F6E08E0|nr:type VI secretion system tip protein VgrG [Burkholderia ubonensis]AYZ62348.1 type VI secretion system tip protein VgrG [Burkholderia multivorans]VWB19734.1 type IV secretion protein Rhs [Burkholderia ubonensis]
MNAVTKTLVDALRHPSARLSQHLGIWIGTLDVGLDVLDFRVRAGFCKDYKVDITVTSPHLDIDGKRCVGRRAGLQIDERVAVPSVNYIDPVDHAAATFNGIVTRWKRIRTSRDEAAYQLRIEPRFAALLKRVHGSRVFRDKSLQEIITELVVDRQNFDAFDIEFNLEGAQEKLEQVVMYEESVWNFIARHCRRKGIFWFYKQGRGKQGQLDTVVFADNPRAYVRSIEVPLMPDSGLTGNWHEAALSLNGERTLVPATIEVWERNYRTPDDPLRATATVSGEDGDRSMFGRINRSAEFHLTQQAGEALVQMRRDEQIARQVTLSGTSNVKGLMPGVVVKLGNKKMPGAEYGFVTTSMEMKGSRIKPAHNSFKAMPGHLAYRPKFDYEEHWRFLEGPVAGLVTTFDSAPYACLDEHGRYPVLPKFLQGSDSADKQLLNLRLVRPSSSYQGGFHSPLLPQTEVLLQGEHNDVDRLHISGALHDYSHPDLVHGAQAMFSYAIWRSPLRGAEIVFNDLREKESARIATVYGKSAMNLGHLLDSKKLKRGEGIDITTRAWGTMRAEKGLYFSADSAGGADTPHLDMPAAIQLLKAALQRVTELADATRQAKAEPADRATQAALMDGLNQLRDAGLLASAPGGMAFVTPKSAQHSAGENVIVTAGNHMDVSITKRLRMMAGELISLCAHKLGINLTAAKGKLTAAALTDGMDLFAQKQLRVASESADVQLAAKSKITLNSGGASLVIENGNMTFHCPGAFVIKAASFTFEGPDNVAVPLPVLPKSGLKISDQYSSSH